MSTSPLTLTSAIAYAAEHIAADFADDSTAFAITGAEFRCDGVDTYVSVSFTIDGCSATFAVWAQRDGSLYGEW